MIGDPVPGCTCWNPLTGTVQYPCPVHPPNTATQIPQWQGWAGYTANNWPGLSISDADVNRIARRVVELLREERDK